MGNKKIDDEKATAAGGVKVEPAKKFFVRVSCPHCGGLHNVDIYRVKKNKMRVPCTDFTKPTYGNTFKLKLVNDGTIPADFFSKTKKKKDDDDDF